MAGLVVKQIEALQPRDVSYEIKDDAEQGLYLVVWPSGSKTWLWRYRFAGKKTKLSLGALSLTEARKRAREARQARDAGIDPATLRTSHKAIAAKVRSAPAADSVEVIFEDFVKKHLAGLRTGSAVERVMRRDMVEPWKGKRLSEITRADVRRLLDTLKERGAAIQANRLLAYLSKFSRWAVSYEYIDKNFTDGVSKPAKERSKERVLSDAELQLVWLAAKEIGWPFGPVVQLLILTGQRKSEIGEGRWSEIGKEERLWTLPSERVKNGHQHVVPLSPASLAIIETLPVIGLEGLVFTTKGKTPISGYSRVKRQIDAIITRRRKEANPSLKDEEATIPEWTFHDLRRTTATGLQRLGFPIDVAEAVLNHVSGNKSGVAGIYARHTYLEEGRQALEAWARHVISITDGASASSCDLN
jgi:integrase